MNRLVRGARWAALFALAAGVIAVPAAMADDPLGQAEPYASGAYFVQFKSKPTAAGGSKSAIDADKAAFKADASKNGVNYRERFSFSTLWSGISISTTAAPTQLSKMSGVQAVYPVLTAPIPETETISPELATALAMTGADIAQDTLGYDGTGVKVAVMDTGIDLDHADLGGDGTAGAPHPNSRVVAQWDFVGDTYNADPSSTAYNPTPSPDPIADDCNGHGTHVSGIVGANGGVTGVAPGVTFGAYRVFGCQGSTTADIMVAAMERALADGMDVLNMSIGSAFNTWAQYPTAAASDLLVDAGMVVVASIGNSGANGVYSAGAPGVGNKVIGTASFDNSHVALTTFTVTPEGLTIGYGNAAGAPPAPTSGSLPLDKTGTPASTADGCSSLAPGSMAGKAVLIRRGTCTFYTKAKNAQDAGASAVVLYNNSAGRFSPTVAGSPAITIPVVAVSDTEGVAINNAIASGPQTLNWTNTTGSFVNPTGGLISSFSSYGLGAELALKPDIGAPGGLIRSTYPLESGAYATISGTSMSSPHVAGSVALLLEARPGLGAQDVRPILQNSADPKNWWGNPGLGFLDNVHRQGAGMLDIDDSILATTTVTPGKLALGESDAGPAVKTLTIENDSAAAVTYDLSHQGALATTGTFSVGFWGEFATVAFSAPSVLVPAGGSATVDVTITAPAGLANKGLYGGYIKLTPQGGGQEYRVPYAGFKGDYQSIQVLVPTANGFPWISRLTACSLARGLDCFVGGNYSKVPPASDTFTMTDAFNVPQILVHFDHQAREAKFEVFQADGVTPVAGAESTIILEEYLPRNSTATGFFAFPWDGKRNFVDKGQGKTHRRAVPDGSYTIKLTVLKALGTAPADNETWTSPVFTIDRP